MLDSLGGSALYGMMQVFDLMGLLILGTKGLLEAGERDPAQGHQIVVEGDEVLPRREVLTERQEAVVERQREIVAGSHSGALFAVGGRLWSPLSLLGGLSQGVLRRH